MLTSYSHVETMLISRATMTRPWNDLVHCSMSTTKHGYNEMTTDTQAVPFHIQPLLSDLYYHKDLLDFSAAGTSNNQQSSKSRLISGPSSPPATSGSLLGTAASLATSAGRKATSTASASASIAKGSATSEDGPRKEVNCVEGYDKNVYIGRSDGIVEWWVIDGNSGDEKVSLTIPNPIEASADSQNNGWTLRHKHTLFPRRAVNKIILLPKVSKCFILSGRSYSMDSADNRRHPTCLHVAFTRTITVDNDTNSPRSR
jgi:hypothetical protein